MARILQNRVGATRWHKDGRLLVGVLLIVCSIAGSYVVLTSMASTQDVYVARETLLPGDRVDPANLSVAAVNLASSDERYVGAGNLHPGDVIIRTVGAGELLPASALGDTSAITATRMVLAVSSSLPEDTPIGASVDIWATRVDAYSVIPSATSLIVPGAILVRVREADPYSADSTMQIEVQLARSALRPTLQAIGDGARLVAVPTVSQAGS